MGGHRISPPFRPDRPGVSGALLFEAAWRTGLKTPEEVMEILEAFDLTGTLRGAAELAGCDHRTVAPWVRARDDAGGGLPVAVRPRPRVDAFAEKIEEWVDRSRGKVRADVAHQRPGRRSAPCQGERSSVLVDVAAVKPRVSGCMQTQRHGRLA